MKKIALIYLLSLGLLANAQLFETKYIILDKVHYQITYTQQAIPDTNNPENIRGGKMLLFIGDSISHYQSRNGYIVDTITRNFKTKEELQNYLNNPTVPYPATAYQIYKHYPLDKLTFIEHNLDGTYKYTEELTDLKWEILPDTSVINDFRTQKAFCNYGGRIWEAWFCKDIPISDGPYKFNGLPGLIVKLNDSKNYYTYVLESIVVPSRNINIDIEDKDYINTTRKEFLKAQWVYRENIMNIVKEKGADNSAMERAARNMTKLNNPIELDR